MKTPQTNNKNNDVENNNTINYTRSQGKRWKQQWKQICRFVRINNKYNRIIKKVEKNPSSYILSKKEINIVAECESDYMATIRKVAWVDLSDVSPKKYGDDSAQTIDDCMRIREIYNRALVHMLDLRPVGGHNHSIKRTYEYWKLLLDSYGLELCFPKKDKDESKDKDRGVSTDE